ncbi:Fic family protein [Yinghuangia seranimata]|uniref:Fic family protein n=1 Tax=Yinghuangia seranimata TaxID=408067 RepID=UPI00248CE674|nr:Fic family protein [Yinghuangia seranimata]MDI2127918.1 Fic family protein [Yinghuangia seranimata]
MSTGTAPHDPFAAIAALPGVPEAVEDARKAVDGLLGHRTMRRRSPEISAESALRGARASAALEGADWSLEEVRRRTDYSHTDDTEAGIVGGALRVSAEYGTLVDVWRRSPIQVLARLHMVAAADAVPADELGRPRLAGESVAVRPDPGPLPSADEVAARLDGLARLLLVPSDAPAIVVAAIVHGEILALQPFVWGNGLVARAAQRLVLIDRGLDPKSAVVPEVGHLDQGADAYEKALRAYVSGTGDGVAEWVRHCAEAVTLGARESVAVCEAVMRGM